MLVKIEYLFFFIQTMARVYGIGDLPKDMLLKISMTSMEIHRGMLTIRGFAMWTLTEEFKEKFNGMLTVDKIGRAVLYMLPGGKLHRFGRPAVEFINGTVIYYLGDKLHRDDGPAETSADGSFKWYRWGKLHRDDGPAVYDKEDEVYKW